jgi:Peptidase family M28
MASKKPSSMHLFLLAGVLCTLHQPLRAQDQAPCAREAGPQAVGMPSTDRIFQWTAGMTGFGERRTGTPAVEKAAAYVKCKLESLGVEDVHYETTPSWKWEATRHALRVNGQAIDSYPAAFTFVTPDQPSVFTTGPDGLSAPLVDVGSGSASMVKLSDVRGKIVLFDLKFQVPLVAFTPVLEFLWDPQLSVLEKSSFVGNPYQTNMSSVVKRLMDAGAVGFVGVLSDYFDSNKYHNEYYRRLQVTMPGLWVTKTEGAQLRARLKANKGRVTANMVMEGSRTWAPASAVIGVLPGKSKDTILVTSHHDSVWNGAVEDATGVASVLAQAQVAASKPLSQREKTLMFVTMDSHFTGYQVHQMFVKKYIIDKQSPYNIVGNVTLEHIGKQGVIENGKLVMREQLEVLGVLEDLSPSLRKTLKQAIKRHDVRRMGMLSSQLLCSQGIGIPTDASFTCVSGVPTASLIAAPIYLYDQADTLDKVAKDALQPVAKVFADLIEAMDKTPSDQMGR